MCLSGAFRQREQTQLRKASFTLAADGHGCQRAQCLRFACFRLFYMVRHVACLRVAEKKASAVRVLCLRTTCSSLRDSCFKAEFPCLLRTFGNSRPVQAFSCSRLSHASTQCRGAYVSGSAGKVARSSFRAPSDGVGAAGRHPAVSRLRCDQPRRVPPRRARVARTAVHGSKDEDWPLSW